jgi:hypothetical protein
MGIFVEYGVHAKRQSGPIVAFLQQRDIMERHVGSRREALNGRRRTIDRHFTADIQKSLLPDSAPRGRTKRGFLN